MTKEPVETPRGHAAWKAERERIAERNEAAWARGRQDRAARNAQAAVGRRDAERRDSQNLPTQPTRPV